MRSATISSACYKQFAQSYNTLLPIGSGYNKRRTHGQTDSASSTLLLVLILNIYIFYIVEVLFKMNIPSVRV